MDNGNKNRFIVFFLLFFSYELFSAKKQQNNVLIDRLILSVDKYNYTQRDMEIYLLVKGITLGSWEKVTIGNWQAKVYEFYYDMLILSTKNVKNSFFQLAEKDLESTYRKMKAIANVDKEMKNLIVDREVLKKYHVGKKNILKTKKRFQFIEQTKEDRLLWFLRLVSKFDSNVYETADAYQEIKPHMIKYYQETTY